ncbi:hypothetical protein K1T71_011261 [Dendrolimus kikuchii]|uniref:Uncharacterized protein n=1 Tax=Dendrolimus kikuchii TaxID=765133 RepID=A0ACC1CND5_9NEOP|nr:hypothetical protein K1T71_011261 [Dendrolimus kikuchii]
MAYTFSCWAVLFFSVFTVYALPKLRTSDIKYPFPFYTKEMWGGKQTGDEPISLPVPYVVIHHTAIPAACNTTRRCKADMRSMQNYHFSLGWSDIGYNFCVGSEGSAFEGRGWYNIGIHAGRANDFSIGICLIGDWRVELPSAKQLETTKQLIAIGLHLGVISPDYKLIGHNQVMTTECPGGSLMEEISHWDNYVPGHIDFSPYMMNKANKL